MYEELAHLKGAGISCGTPRVVIDNMQHDDQVNCSFPNIGHVELWFQTYPHAPYVVFSECFLSTALGNVTTFERVLEVEGALVLSDFQSAKVIRDDKPHNYRVLRGSKFTYTHFVESGCIWDSRMFVLKKPPDPWSD